MKDVNACITCLSSPNKGLRQHRNLLLEIPCDLRILTESDDSQFQREQEN